MGKEYISLRDYSIIGNCRSAALVSRYGSIDWCCMPEFHSPGIFASLLDVNIGGYFRIQPVSEYNSKQEYIENTNIIETTFENAEGSARLLDGYVAVDENDKIINLFPDHEILRIIEGISGTVLFRIEFFPKIFYGKVSPVLRNYGKLGIQFSYKENTFILQSSLDINPFKLSKEKVIAEFSIKEGERVLFSFSCSGQCPAIIPELRQTGWERMQKTINYWKTWASKCKYNGIFRENVIRSALLLKLLTHAPSGAIIAAPTTSLPEEIGGMRNWDYRYCWLRDASFTIRVLVKLGYFDEAHAYMNWILHATRLTRPELQVVYTVFGNSKIEEKNCEWLEGYKKSNPVRIGNSAHEQFQLDVYGEVLDAVYIYSQLIDSYDNNSKNFIIGLGKEICKLWNQPDDGIWEIRSSRSHQTHSKVMAWVGLDRLIKLSAKYKWNAPVEKFNDIKDKLFKDIEENGYNKSTNHYTRDFGGNDLDAALLLLPIVGYNEANSAGMKNTIQKINSELQNNDFFFRYVNLDDGLPGKEGAFIICNFWFIENLAKTGKIEEAVDLFKKTVSIASSTGLLSEETDPDSKELLGNYPQGFSHIGLINAAITIDEIIKLKQGNKI